MTVLVGVYCADGVVIGSDSAATSSHGRTPLIKQNVTKIDTLGDKLVFATTGSVGLHQRFRNHIQAEWNEKGFQNDPHTVATSLCRRTIADFQSTGVPIDPQLGLNFGALLAAPISDKHHLVEFATIDFQPEIKGEEMHFVSMGSGQVLAEPFLGFMHRVFWMDDLPALNEGIFGAVWALNHTIDLVPGMVGGPVQLATLERGKKGQWQARKLSEDELGEHLETCDAMEQHIRQFRIDKPDDKAEEPPVPPSPPGKKL